VAAAMEATHRPFRRLGNARPISESLLSCNCLYSTYFRYSFVDKLRPSFTEIIP
jgi:hypothetical protein